MRFSFAYPGQRENLTAPIFVNISKVHEKGRMLMQRAIRVGVTFLVGAVVGFFLAGPVVFADSTMSERVSVLGVAAVIYLLLGAGAGWWLRTWRAGIWLASPSMIVALALGEAWSVIGPTMGVLLVSAVGGACLGSRGSSRRPGGLS